MEKVFDDVNLRWKIMNIRSNLMKIDKEIYDNKKKYKKTLKLIEEGPQYYDPWEGQYSWYEMLRSPPPNVIGTPMCHRIDNIW